VLANLSQCLEYHNLNYFLLLRNENIRRKNNRIGVGTNLTFRDVCFLLSGKKCYTKSHYTTIYLPASLISFTKSALIEPSSIYVEIAIIFLPLWKNVISNSEKRKEK
jgi:hypothetical protein